MPIQVSENRFVANQYTPDYLKNKKRYQTDPSIVCTAIGVEATQTDIILDGGNVVRSKNTIILTDKVFKENMDELDWAKLLG